MTEPLRVILAGVGRRGRWPVEVATADPAWRPVALVDVDLALRAEAAAICGLAPERGFERLEDALAAVPSDAVIICTPTQWHAPLARLAFEAGRHVLVEKGMTTDLPTALDLVARAEAAGVRFCVAQNYRYGRVELAFHQYLRSGEVGAPHLVDLICHRHRPEPRTLNYPGAMLWDMGCHHFDSLIHHFGPVAGVVGRTYSAPWSRYDHHAGVSAVLTFESGLVATYVLTHCAQFSDYRFVAQTDTGTVQVGQGITFRPAGARAEAARPLAVPQGPRSEQLVLDAFRRYIAEGEEPGISGRNNLQVMAVSAAILEASARGRAVDVQALLA